jgi:hypothetical protein
VGEPHEIAEKLAGNGTAVFRSLLGGTLRAIRTSSRLHELQAI